MSDSDDHDEHDDSANPAIRRIEEESVQRIVAGQAVTDLASAVKELVDNSLDAHSSSINIRLFNQGLDIVEVTDDGVGVPAASRPYMATPHATSKIRSFEDIYRDTNPLSTLGFRGEALFCLANLCQKLMVATRTADETMAQKMEFKRDGTIDPNSVGEMHRKVGTTVAVMKLLDALPVRRMDMKRSIQRQRHKLVRMMEGYAIFSVGVRLCLMDMVVSGGSYKEQPLLTTSLTSNSVEENISAVMGSRFLSDLTRITVDLSSCHPDTATESDESTSDQLQGEASAEQPQIQGFVSSAKPQESLRSQRRIGNQRVRNAQFFSINGRPVELPQVSRVLSDAWRAFGPSSEGKKKPSCVLCFTLPNSAYDINLTPEKRQVVLTKEKEICQLIHEAATKLWASQAEGQFTQNELPTSLQPAPELTGNIGDMFASLAAVKKRSYQMSTEDEDLSAMSPDSRKRHKRRHAFVHDFNKAKMQHEHDDRRKKQEIPSSEEVGLETTPAKSSNDINEVNDGLKEGENVVNLVAQADTRTDDDTSARAGPDSGIVAGNEKRTVSEEHISSRDKLADMDAEPEVTSTESADIKTTECLGAGVKKGERCSAPSSSTKNTAHSDANSVKTNDVQKFEQEGDEICEEPFKVSPITAEGGKTDAELRSPATKSFNTTIRKVSNDKFTTAQHNEDMLDEPATVVEPKTISPLNSKVVKELNSEDNQQQVDSGVNRRRVLDIPSSDADRRRWIEVQARFNRGQSGSHNDEYQSLLSSGRKSPSNQVSPQEDRDISTKGASDSTRQSKEQNSSDLSNTGQKKTNMFDLAQFACRRVSNDNNNAASALATAQSKQHNERNTSRSQLLQGQTSMKTRRSVNARSIESQDSFVSNKAASTHSPLQESDVSSSALPSDVIRRISNFGSETRKSSNCIQVKENKKSENLVDDTKTSPTSQLKKTFTQSTTPSPDDNESPKKEFSEQDSDEDVLEQKVVHWGSFKGTKDIVISSRLERMKMREYRRNLKRGRSNQSSSGTAESTKSAELENVGAAGKTITLSKGKFSKMTVVGQFNLGFILAKCPNNHLWILDQHACDEKYNFERLVANTIIHEQKLIAPMPLELSPSEETCILDHMDIFEKNGFRFKYDPDKNPRHRLALTALPHSGACDGRKAVQFGKEDVSALCAILSADADGYGDYADYSSGALGGGTGTDGGGMYGNNAVRRYAGSSVINRNKAGQNAGNSGDGDTAEKIISRLPKAIAMFASRACRSSIMIGTALSSKEMEKVIKHVDEVEDPWTCAHGRPTMSHVGDLHPLLLQESDKDAAHIAGPTVTIMTQQMTTQEDE